MSSSASNKLAAVLFAAFFVLSAAYAFKVQPGNAPDEREHVEYVLYLKAHHALPVWNWPEDKSTWEARQPPLYYFLQALLLGVLGSVKPIVGLTAMRLFSSLFHLLAVFALWRACRILYGDGWKSLGPPALMAFLPQFVFIGASVNNDAAADLAGTALLCYLAARIAARKPTEVMFDPWDVGALCGFALLCKATMLPVIAIALYVTLYPGPPLINERRETATNLKSFLVALALAGALAGWYYMRNTILYHDAIGVGEKFKQYDPDRYAWSQLGTWWTIFFSSFWGRFGLMTQPMSMTAYAEAGILSLAAVAGWIQNWDRLSKLPARKLLLFAFGLTVLQNFVFGFFLSYQPQARLSFPALAAWAILMFDGIESAFLLLPDKARPRLSWLAGALVLFMNVDAYLHL